jgi:hypothetical protein
MLRKGGIKGSDVREKFGSSLRKYQIDFSFKDAGLQESNCISEVALKSFLVGTRIGRLSVEQRQAQNELHRYLGIDPITEEPRFIDTLSREKIGQYPLFIQDAINDVLKENPRIKWQRCRKCTDYYPFHLNFFRHNATSPDGIDTICRDCYPWDHNRQRTDMIKRNDDELNKIYKKYGEDLYKAFKEDNLEKVYRKYLNDELKHLPDCYQNKDDYLRIIKWLYENKYINVNNIGTKILINDCKLKNLTKLLTMHEIFSFLFGENYFYYPWKYPTMQFKSDIKLTYDIANNVLNNYIREFDVDSSDPLEIDYDDLIRKAKLTQLRDLGSSLYFAVQYNQFKYAGYMFKTKSSTYYNDDENIKFDLKYLIEEDMKIPVDKIPLYLTRNNLQKHCRTLYHQIVTNKNKSIFEWVNELYPNKYIEADFDVNAYRNEFDSDTEAFIDDILRQEFKNVYYNQRNTNRTVTLNGNVPDWLVFTDNGVWIVEFLGMYLPDKTDSRTLVYIEKTERKFKKYESVSGYNILYLLPEDIEKNFSGVKEKIKVIK